MKNLESARPLRYLQLNLRSGGRTLSLSLSRKLETSTRLLFSAKVRYLGAKKTQTDFFSALVCRSINVGSLEHTEASVLLAVCAA